MNNPSNLKNYSEIIRFQVDRSRGELVFNNPDASMQRTLQSFAHSLGLIYEFSRATSKVTISRPILPGFSGPAEFDSEILSFGHGNFQSDILEVTMPADTQVEGLRSVNQNQPSFMSRSQSEPSAMGHPNISNMGTGPFADAGLIPFDPDGFPFQLDPELWLAPQSEVPINLASGVPESCHMASTEAGGSLNTNSHANAENLWSYQPESECRHTASRNSSVGSSGGWAANPRPGTPFGKTSITNSGAPQVFQEMVFDSCSTRSASDVSTSSGRRGPLNQSTRDAIKALKAAGGACWICKFQRKTVGLPFIKQRLDTRY